MVHPVPHRSTLGVLLMGILLLAVSATAAAQGAPGFRLGISGGADFPVEDQEDIYDIGWNGTLMFNWNFGTSPFGLRMDGSYHQFQVQEELEPIFVDARTDIMDGTLNFVFGPHICGWFQPYIFGGAGAYSLRFRTEDIDEDFFTDRVTRFGWNAGTGFAFKVAPESNIHLFVEGRYHSIDLDADPFDDIDTTDRRFSVVTVNTGIVF